MAIDRPVFREGDWSLCDRTGWPDNQTCRKLVAWNWAQGEARYLIVVNLSGAPAQGLVHIPWSDLRGRDWHLQDVLSDAAFTRNGEEMAEIGLYVDLGPWNGHFLRFTRPAG